MSDSIDQPEQISDEQRLEYTQAKRKMVIEDLMKEGKAPQDKGEKMVLLTALSDMDKVSLTKLKIKADEKQADTTSQASAILSRFLTMVVPNKVRHFDPDIKTPVLGEEIPAIELVDGETAVGTQNVNYETFQKLNTFQKE